MTEREGEEVGNTELVAAGIAVDSIEAAYCSHRLERKEEVHHFDKPFFQGIFQEDYRVIKDNRNQ